MKVLTPLASLAVIYFIFLCAGFACIKYCQNTASVLAQSQASLHWSGKILSIVSWQMIAAYSVAILIGMASALAIFDERRSKIRTILCLGVISIVPYLFLAWTCHSYSTRLSMSLS